MPCTLFCSLEVVFSSSAKRDVSLKGTADPLSLFAPLGLLEHFAIFLVVAASPRLERLLRKLPRVTFLI